MVSTPRVTLVEHLVHVAEVATLAALALLLVLLVHAVLHWVNRRGPQPATLLVREVRASFTRKLFLAFVALTLAALARWRRIRFRPDPALRYEDPADPAVMTLGLTE